MYLLVLLSVMSFMENCLEAKGNKSNVSKHCLTCQMPLTQCVSTYLVAWILNYEHSSFQQIPLKCIVKTWFVRYIFVIFWLFTVVFQRGPIQFLQYTNHLHKNVANDDYFNFFCMLMTLIVLNLTFNLLDFFFFFLWLKRIDKRKNLFFLCNVKCYICIQLNLLEAYNKEVKRCRIMLVFRVEGSPLQPFSQCFLEEFRLMLFQVVCQLVEVQEALLPDTSYTSR